MSASCEWTLALSGKNRNKYLKEILDALYKIENIINPEDGQRVFKVSDGKTSLPIRPKQQFSLPMVKQRKYGASTIST